MKTTDCTAAEYTETGKEKQKSYTQINIPNTLAPNIPALFL